MSPERMLVQLQPAPVLSLGPDEVHVWRAKLDAATPALVGAMTALLSPDETERARKFYFERDRRRFAICRGILRTLLGRYLGAAPAGIAFRYGPNGKPALSLAHAAGPRGVALSFNVAHSDDLALFAIAGGGEIGIDVERIRELPDWEAVAEVSFSPQELARLRACEPAHRRDEFFRAWTRQEAVLKALGTGLGIATATAGACTRGFHVHSLELDPRYAAALAARGGARVSLHIRGWQELERAAGSAPDRRGDPPRRPSGISQRVSHP